MKHFLQLLCFVFLYGIYLTDCLFVFVPSNSEMPPKCPPFEMYKMCTNNCSNCEQRGICITHECKQSGCDCLPHFVRLTPDGPCVPTSMCPKPECRENEVFRECGPMCERCGTMNCRMVHCEYRCYCKEGYKRDAEGTCIPVEECPPKVRCAREEEWRDSGLEDEFCLHADDEFVSNTTVNVTRCYCRDGFKRNGLGHCMPDKYCPVVRCIGHETYQSCPRRCNSTCRTYGDPDCVEDGHCYPGCFCPEGFLMNDFRACVPLEHCPPGSNPFVPTLPPPVETTIPSSVSTTEETEEKGVTTSGSATTEADQETEKSSVADTEESDKSDSPEESSDSDDDEELPENLSDEDIVTGDETVTVEGSSGTTASPKNESSKKEQTAKSSAKAQETEQSTEDEDKSEADDDSDE